MSAELKSDGSSADDNSSGGNSEMHNSVGSSWTRISTEHSGEWRMTGAQLLQRPQKAHGRVFVVGCKGDFNPEHINSFTKHLMYDFWRCEYARIGWDGLESMNTGRGTAVKKETYMDFTRLVQKWNIEVWWKDPDLHKKDQVNEEKFNKMVFVGGMLCDANPKVAKWMRFPLGTALDKVKKHAEEEIFFQDLFSTTRIEEINDIYQRLRYRQPGSTPEPQGNRSRVAVSPPVGDVPLAVNFSNQGDFAVNGSRVFDAGNANDMLIDGDMPDSSWLPTSIQLPVNSRTVSLDSGPLLVDNGRRSGTANSNEVALPCDLGDAVFNPCSNHSLESDFGPTSFTHMPRVLWCYEPAAESSFLDPGNTIANRYVKFSTDATLLIEQEYQRCGALHPGDFRPYQGLVVNFLHMLAKNETTNVVVKLKRIAPAPPDHNPLLVEPIAAAFTASDQATSSIKPNYPSMTQFCVKWAWKEDPSLWLQHPESRRLGDGFIAYESSISESLESGYNQNPRGIHVVPPDCIVEFGTTPMQQVQIGTTSKWEVRRFIEYSSASYRGTVKTSQSTASNMRISGFHSNGSNGPINEDMNSTSGSFQSPSGPSAGAAAGSHSWYWQETPARLSLHDTSKTITNGFVAYDADVSKKLEDAFVRQQGQGLCNPMEGYVVDFASATQINASTGFKRSIKRVPASEKAHIASRSKAALPCFETSASKASRSVPRSSRRTDEPPKSRVSENPPVPQRQRQEQCFENSFAGVKSRTSAASLVTGKSSKTVSSEKPPGPGSQRHTQNLSDSCQDSGIDVVWSWEESEVFLSKHDPSTHTGNGSFIKYDDETSKGIEAAFQLLGKAGKYKTVEAYEINFLTMEQTNLSTGFRRRVKRLATRIQAAEVVSIDASAADPILFTSTRQLPREDSVPKPHEACETTDDTKFGNKQFSRVMEASAVEKQNERLEATMSNLNLG